ncbi:MAG: heavy metal-responsive transcriptional regulator [Acidobacteriota bacterium]
MLDLRIGSRVYNAWVSQPTNSKAYLRSGELAAQAGVSTDTLRHYERKGLIREPRRSPNGYREYSLQSLERLQLVRRALAVGFTLDELARVLRVRDKGGAPCRQVRELAAVKLNAVEAQIKQMSALRDELRGLLSEWDSLLDASTTGQPVHLLERLAARPRITARRIAPLRPLALQGREKK